MYLRSAGNTTFGTTFSTLRGHPLGVPSEESVYLLIVVFVKLRVRKRRFLYVAEKLQVSISFEPYVLRVSNFVTNFAFHF